MAGLVGGVALAFLLDGHATLETGVIVIAVFGMYYLFTTSYTLSMFCVTILLGLLYGLLGADLEPLLMLRLEETAVGAVAAVLVAAFVLPARTRDQVRRSGATVLSALAEAVRSSRGAPCRDGNGAAAGGDAAGGPPGGGSAAGAAAPAARPRPPVPPDRGGAVGAGAARLRALGARARRRRRGPAPPVPRGGGATGAGNAHRTDAHRADRVRDGDGIRAARGPAV
ncbi:MAG: FUSC family protein [Acetobacteraceae bacterium]